MGNGVGGEDALGGGVMKRWTMGFVLGFVSWALSGCGDFSPVRETRAGEWRYQSPSPLVNEDGGVSGALDGSVVGADAVRETQVPAGGRDGICRVHANLPGTLLRNQHGAYWMLERWPDRAIVPPEQFRDARFRVEDALPMTLFHEQCFRDRGGAWFSREALLWTLMRLPWGGVAYVDRTARFWSRATPEAIEAWRDDVARAPMLEVTRDVWDAEYREQPMRGFPGGTLIQTEAGLFLVMDGRFHRFTTQDLAVQAGYRPERAIRTSEDRRVMFADTGESITADFLSLCPMAVARARREEDADEDGAIRGIDCDDWDARRAPHLLERCDGVDNNCDERVDEGFNASLPCRVDNDCREPGVYVCADDGWHTRCEALSDRGCP